MWEYNYIGDKQTNAALKGAGCNAIRRNDGKCIRGKNGSMLVLFSTGRHVVVARLLRKNKRIIHGGEEDTKRPDR